MCVVVTTARGPAAEAALRETTHRQKTDADADRRADERAARGSVEVKRHGEAPWDETGRARTSARVKKGAPSVQPLRGSGGGTDAPLIHRRARTRGHQRKRPAELVVPG